MLENRKKLSANSGSFLLLTVFFSYFHMTFTSTVTPLPHTKFRLALHFASLVSLLINNFLAENVSTTLAEFMLALADDYLFVNFTRAK